MTGDQIIAICTRHLKETNALQNDLVVTTIMSNLGLGQSLKKNGVRHEMVQVGDRYVMETMRNSGAILGGEDSGHIIFLNHHTTGDGILAALKLLEVMTQTGKPLSELSSVMRVFPQKLINVPVSSKPPLETIPEICAEIRGVERRMGEEGRVLVRYSGTQSLCRIMVEGPTDLETERYCQQIALAIEKYLN